MEKVKDTKNPTIKQLRNIAENLKGHLKTFANVSVEAKCYDHIGNTFMEYGIYIASDGLETHMFESWPELLSFYHKLMNSTEGNFNES